MVNMWLILTDNLMVNMNGDLMVGATYPSEK